MFFIYFISLLLRFQNAFDDDDDDDDDVCLGQKLTNIKFVYYLLRQVFTANNILNPTLSQCLHSFHAYRGKI